MCCFLLVHTDVNSHMDCWNKRQTGPRSFFLYTLKRKNWLCTRNDGLIPPVTDYRPFEGGASVMVYSKCAVLFFVV